MSRIETATCGDCGWAGQAQATRELRDFWDRVMPGDTMPAGQCPNEGCGGLAMLDADDDKDRLRPAMVALMLGLDGLRESIGSDTLTMSVVTQLRELADCARRALAAGPLVQPVCIACGGIAVRVDAWARWDTSTQRWELHEVREAAAICADCDIECAYTMKPVAGAV